MNLQANLCSFSRRNAHIAVHAVRETPKAVGDNITPSGPAGKQNLQNTLGVSQVTQRTIIHGTTLLYKSRRSTESVAMHEYSIASSGEEIEGNATENWVRASTGEVAPEREASNLEVFTLHNIDRLIEFSPATTRRLQARCVCRLGQAGEAVWGRLCSPRKVGTVNDNTFVFPTSCHTYTTQPFS